MVKNAELATLKSEMDLWVKDALKKIEDSQAQLHETNSNTDFNYELIKDIKMDLVKLKEEVKALRLLLLVFAKGKLRIELVKK